MCVNFGMDLQLGCETTKKMKEEWLEKEGNGAKKAQKDDEKYERPNKDMKNRFNLGQSLPKM